jgi:hypothetical protein
MPHTLTAGPTSPGLARQTPADIGQLEVRFLQDLSVPRATAGILSPDGN